jgi:MHS family proline/betaine transporter-like MFS transporter
VLLQQILTREQKQAVGLLSIGTFLEYFDLMLYVHMVVLLNDLFFPKYDPETTKLLVAFTFCSTYLLRPIGALIFGWIGDNIGRKYTVVITTFMMAGSCLVVATLPTYAEIGITATWCIIICRILQGMSSMGEIIGAQVYLTETIKRPKQYPIVALLDLFAALGSTVALGVASLSVSQGFNWRYAFWFGVVVAIIGSAARSSLRETPDFVDAKARITKRFEDAGRDTKILEKNPMWKEKINIKTALAFFLIQCGWPVCFYIAFMHCGNILQSSFGYSAAQVIQQNFILSIVEMLGCAVLMVYLSYYLYPILILKIKLVIMSVILLLSPYLFNNAQNPFVLLLIQSSIMFFVLASTPAKTIFMSYFPVLRRFTSAAFLFALSRTLMFIVTSFGCVYLEKHYGNYGLLFIIIPVLIGFGFGILHFEKLEKESANYPENTKNLGH